MSYKVKIKVDKEAILSGDLKTELEVFDVKIGDFSRDGDKYIVSLEGEFTDLTAYLNREETS